MKKLVFLVLLFVTSLSFGQATDTSRWIKNDGSFNYNNWKVRSNLIIPTKTDTTNKTSGLTQIIGTDLYFVATDHKWKTYISDTSGIHTQLANQLAAIQANASSITGKQSQLNGTGFVKSSGTSISYDNTSYTPASRTIKINGVTKDLSSNQDWGTISGTTIDTAGKFLSNVIVADDTTVYFVKGDTLIPFRIRQNKITLTTNVTNGTATLINNVLNIPPNSGGGITSVKQTHTSGAAVTINNTTTWFVVDPSALLAALTVTMPSTPTDGQKIEFSFGGTIVSGNVVTALTVAGNAGQTVLQSSSPSSIMAGETISYRYNISNTKWYRIN